MENEKIDMAFQELDALKKAPAFVRRDITAPDATESENSDDLSHVGKHTANDSLPAFEGNGEAENAPQAQNPGAPQQINMGQFLKPELMIEMGDRVIVTLLVLALSYIDKKNRYNKGDLSATRDEKKMLEPLVDAFLKSVNFKVENPANALLIGIACVYGTKIIDARANAIQSKPRHKTAAPLFNEMPIETILNDGDRLPSGRKPTRKPGETRGRKPKSV